MSEDTISIKEYDDLVERFVLLLGKKDNIIREQKAVIELANKWDEHLPHCDADEYLTPADHCKCGLQKFTEAFEILEEKEYNDNNDKASSGIDPLVMANPRRTNRS